MDIAVVPLDPADDRAAEQAYEIAVACTRFDVPDYPQPCRYSFRAGLNHPWPGNSQEWVFVRVDGRPVGYACLSFPELDNTANMPVEVYVHPEHRRRGAGRALFDHIVGRARERSRQHIMVDTVGSLPGGPPRGPAGSAFAEAMGAKAALTEVRRRLDLNGVDEAELTRLLDASWPKAAGYSVVRFGNNTPEEYVDDIAYLDGRLVQDAPMGDLAWEPQKVDADRIRGAERAIEVRQRRQYNTAMRHDESGHLVAWTGLALNRSTEWHAWQQITIVDPRHRGHRLGMIVKIENLRYVRAAEPLLRIIDTFNAAENDHMISINEAMGFRPVDAWTNWQLTL